MMTPTGGTMTSNVAGAYSAARASYDPEADALDIELVRHGQGPDVVVAFTRVLAPGILADFDGSGHIIGVEILGVTKLPQSWVSAHKEGDADES